MVAQLIAAKELLLAEHDEAGLTVVLGIAAARADADGDVGAESHRSIALALERD